MPLQTLEVKRDEDGDPKFSSYFLSKWSRMVRIREMRTCRLCKQPFPEIKYLHAHHIKPKHKFPEHAYDLRLGIALCAKCHIRTLHTDESNETSFIALFWPYLHRKDVIAFNQKWQYKVTGTLVLPRPWRGCCN